MKKTTLLVTSLVVSGCLLSLFATAHWYMRAEYRLFAFFASDPTLHQVEQRLGRPDEIVTAGKLPQQKGWPLPRINRETEIWIYSVRTGRNFHVHVNPALQRIEYVFSSSS